MLINYIMSDTLTISQLYHLQNQIDSLQNQIAILRTKEDFFYSVISHQQTLFTIQTAIFAAFITTVLIIAGLITWKAFFQKIYQRVDKQDRDFKYSLAEIKKEYSEKIDEHLKKLTEDVSIKLSKIESDVLQAKNLGSRSLYEQKNSENQLDWKIIWHIRYLKYFGTSNLNDLKTRMQILEKEYNKLKSSRSKNKTLLKFENLGGLKSTLDELSNIDEPEVKRIASFLLNDLRPSEEMK